MFSLALLATLALAAHEIKITIALDNKYKLYLPNQPEITGPADGEDGIAYGWANVKTHTISVEGEGPYVIGVHGVDYGVISGLFAGVTLDGKPYSSTGIETTKFKGSIEKPADNWLDPTFDDSTWQGGAALAPADCNDPIWDNASGGQFTTSLTTQMPEQLIKASWLPSCAAVNTEVYFRLVIHCPPTEVVATVVETTTVPVDVYTTTVPVDIYQSTITEPVVAPVPTDAYKPAEPVVDDAKPVTGGSYEAPVESAAPIASAAPEADVYAGEEQGVLASSATKISTSVVGILALLL